MLHPLPPMRQGFPLNLARPGSWDLLGALVPRYNATIESTHPVRYSSSICV